MKVDECGSRTEMSSLALVEARCEAVSKYGEIASSRRKGRTNIESKIATEYLDGNLFVGQFYA